MEALVILIVPIIALAVAAAAYFQPRTLDPIAERARLDQHLAWLEERVRHAEQRNWDEQMMERLQGELAEARRRKSAFERG